VAPQIELDEVQGNVLHAYGTRFPQARYVHLQVADGAGDAARGVLARWAGEVAFGRPEPRDDAHVNLALTHAGLAAVGVSDDMLDAFPPEFREGAWERSPQVDGHAAARDAWEDGLGRGHVLLVVHGGDEDACLRRVDALLAEARDAGDPLRESAAQQPAALLDHGGDADVSCGNRYSREHFGFADGCSQPAVEGVDDDPEGDGLNLRLHPQGTARQLVTDVGLRPTQRAWRPVRAGEFLLGYCNEDGRQPDGPDEPLGPNGTFMVYRKIEQHVERFDAQIEREAERLGLEKDELRARILGRWPDGTPLDRSPTGEDPRISNDRRGANLFDYADDPGGLRCPLGAHVRRTNPRNGLPGGAEMTRRHRIIRRGMPYADAGGRGLVFIAYNSSIKQGFETIQRFWCHEGESLGLGREPDYLLQQPVDGRPLSGMVVNYAGATPQRIEPPSEPFVTVRGCEYLFLPSRRACAWLTGL
jgi:Dyp-type peroxidase family